MLMVKLGSSGYMRVLSTSTTQKLGRFFITLKHLNVTATVGTTLIMHFGVGTISATTICLSAILPSKIAGKLHEPHYERDG